MKIATESKFTCTEHDVTTKFSSSEDVRTYLNSRYAETYTLKSHGSKVEVICNSSVVAVVKKIIKK